MKKILFLVAALSLLFTSCSQSDSEIAPATETAITKTSLTARSGDLVAYLSGKVKDGALVLDSEAEFVSVYNGLTELSTEEFERWITSGGKTTPIVRDYEVDDDYVEPEQVYSDFFLSLLNDQYKFVIGTKKLWFNGGKIYTVTNQQFTLSVTELKRIESQLPMYGGMYSEAYATSAGANKVPNQNKSKTWRVNFPDYHRVDITLFNETIYLYNNAVAISKMFLKYKKEYRTKLVFGTKWRPEIMNSLNSLYFNVHTTGVFVNTFPSSMSYVNPNTKTIEVAHFSGFPNAAVFYISGYTTLYYKGSTMNQTLSWY
nr:hypothetical protein [uncultured Flavobacterium sp.]